jgi:hypothetical protein
MSKPMFYLTLIKMNNTKYKTPSHMAQNRASHQHPHSPLLHQQQKLAVKKKGKKKAKIEKKK